MLHSSFSDAAFEDSPIFCGPVWMSGMGVVVDVVVRVVRPMACRLRLSLQNGSSLFPFFFLTCNSATRTRVPYLKDSEVNIGDT